MSQRRMLCTLPVGLLLFMLGVALPGSIRAEQPTAAQPSDITVAMEECTASRPGKITSDTSIFRLLFLGLPTDALVKRGVVEVDGEKHTLYLPKSESYSTQNTQADDRGSQNTSTLISVDHNGDRQLTDEESWFASLPLRLGDKMFDVTEISADGSRIVLRPSKAPLRGAIVGRICPPFSFRTADGQEVSLDRLTGKAFVVDIWSVT